jgi:two-component system, NtrC family, sensor kinase
MDDAMDDASITQRLKELEKENRILKKQLSRSKADRLQLEDNYARNGYLLRQIINDLEGSKLVLEERGQALELALHDIQRMQGQLVESEKMSALGVLVAGVAHEINNPVGFIYGNIGHLEHYTIALLELTSLYEEIYPSPHERIAATIEAIDLPFLRRDIPKVLKSMWVGAERILEIVKSLRNFSRLDEAEFKAVDLHEGIDSTLMILQSQLKGSPDRPQIEVVKRYSNLPLVQCYPGKLNQVFMNILGNAIDALVESYGVNPNHADNDSSDSKAAVISIDTVVQRDDVKISISDNGNGIPIGTQSKLFDPFFTTKEVGKGTGLGLSISYQIIVENHHGKLSCQSELSKGTTFTIVIPIVQKNGTSRALPTSD